MGEERNRREEEDRNQNWGSVERQFEVLQKYLSAFVVSTALLRLGAPVAVKLHIRQKACACCTLSATVVGRAASIASTYLDECVLRSLLAGV